MSENVAGDLERELAQSSDRNVLREGADARFAEARGAAGEIVGADVKHATRAVVAALEGLMLQVRDHDNTQFYGFKGVAEGVGKAASDAVAEFAGAIADAFTAGQGGR